MKKESLSEGDGWCISLSSDRTVAAIDKDDGGVWLQWTRNGEDGKPTYTRVLLSEEAAEATVRVIVALFNSRDSKK